MKHDHKYTLLFLVVLAGVLLCWGTPGFATEIERSCDNAPSGACLEIENSLGQVVYIVKAVKLDEDGKPLDFGLGETLEPDPQGDGTVAFHYWGGISQAYIDSNRSYSKPSAWSYIVFSLADVPLDAEPPGAQLPLDDFNCGEAVISPERVAYKLNPSVNFKGDAVFSLYAPAGTKYDPCGNGNGKAYVLFGKECNGGTLAVPQIGELPFVQQRRFWCSEKVFIEVEYDQCTGVPDPQIKYYNLKESETPNPIDYEQDADEKPISPYVYAELPDAAPVDDRYDRNFQVTNWGPAYGTLLCTDTDPVFVWKDRAYFCE